MFFILTRNFLCSFQKFFHGTEVFIIKHFKITRILFSNSSDVVSRDLGIVLQHFRWASGVVNWKEASSSKVSK